MNKDNNYIYGLILSISLITNVLFLYSKFTKNILFKDKEGTLVQLVIDKTAVELYTESLSFNQFEMIIDIKGDSIQIGSVCENPKQLYLLVSDNSCDPCVYYCLEDLNSFVYQIGVENVTVLGLYQNKREFFLLSKKYPFQFYLLTENSIFEEIASKSPLFFTTDRSTRISSAFFPISKYRVLTQNYIDLFSRIVFN